MKYIYSLLMCFTLLIISSCGNNNGGEDPVTPEPSHTYLLYIIGDNSLTQYKDIASTNIRLIEESMLKATKDINIVVYKDSRDSKEPLPVLFQLKKTIDKTTQKAKIDTIYIKKYEYELNSCDPEVFKKVVNETFTMFNTEVKGIEIWGHGLSWFPSPYASPKTRYVGIDDNNYFELWDFRKAMEGCPHVDYITFDACYTATAEIANELDGVCDYVYGPINEIMDSGYPYKSMIAILEECQSKAEVRKTLENCIDDFAKSKINDANGYTIALLETAKADKLGKALGKLRNANKSACEYLQENASELEKDFQSYNEDYGGNEYLLYDFHDYADYLASSATEESKSIVQEIRDNDIVVKYAHSDCFRYNDGAREHYIDLKGCKGLGVTIPELILLNERYGTKYMSYYGDTKWGKNLGY